MSNKLFIAIEGCDGAGKTTIRKKIYNYLNQRHECIVIGKHSWLIPKYAKIILDIKYNREKYTSKAILEAYGYDSKMLWERTISRNIKNYSIIADRYIFSHIIYLNALHNIPLIEAYNYFEELKIGLPNVVVYVDTPPNLCEERILKKRGIIDVYGHKKIQDYWETEETLNIIQKKYKDLFTSNIIKFKTKVIVIDNSGNENCTDIQIAEFCEELLANHKLI